jgi:hypothetical protein
MAEERKLSQRKPIKTTFISDADLPVHYVNIVNVRAGLEEFFITLGTVMPPEITDITDLEGIDSLNAHTLLRFAVSRSVMKQMLEVMQAIYDQQTSQLEMLQTVQEEDQERE